MKVSFTGTREGMTVRQWRQLRQWLEEAAWPGREITESHHGCCIGADSEFVLAMLDTGVTTIHAHPSTLKGMTDEWALKLSKVKHPPLPPLDRNRVMVDVLEAGDWLLATPKGPEEMRSGTWFTIRYARKQRKQIRLFWPNGESTEDNK